MPKIGYEGKFSIPYCVATALRNGKVSLEDFTDEKVNDSETQELLSKVCLVHPENWGSGGVDLTTEIVLKLKDGTEYSHTVSQPKGEPENPLTDDELSNKFRACASLVFNSKDIEKVLDLAWHWEELKDLTEPMRILGPMGAHYVD